MDSNTTTTASTVAAVVSATDNNWIMLSKTTDNNTSNNNSLDYYDYDFNDFDENDKIFRVKRDENKNQKNIIYSSCSTPNTRIGFHSFLFIFLHVCSYIFCL